MKVLGSKVFIFIAQDSYLKGSALLRPGARPLDPAGQGPSPCNPIGAVRRIRGPYP